MKYDQFEEEDFILDDYFQKWVLDNDAMAQNFWKNWLKDRPEKVAVITRAREYVYLLAKDNDSLSDASFDAMWQNIVQKRSDLPTAIPALSYQANKSVWSTLLRVAAVFIGLIGTVAFLHFVGAFDRVTMVYPNEVTLELQDGSLRPLDETDVEIIEDENGDGLVNHQKTKLNYKAVAQVGKKKTAELAYNIEKSKLATEQNKALILQKYLDEVAKITIRQKVGDKHQIFGSINDKDIIAQILQLTGINLEKKHIHLPEIKIIGIYSIKIEILHNIYINLKLQIVPSEIKIIT